MRRSGNFEQTGKVRENDTIYWKSPGISGTYYLLFLVIFNELCFQFKKKEENILKRYRKNEKNTGNGQGILSVRKSGNHNLSLCPLNLVFRK